VAFPLQYEIVKGQTFEDELLELLRKTGTDFDPNDVLG